jgi:hypothetical protein
MLKLVNQNVKFVDSVALAAIASAVTATGAVAASWSTRHRCADPRRRGSGQGEHPGAEPGLRARHSSSSDDATWARAYAAFTSGGFLPREDAANSAVVRHLRGCRRDAFLPTPNLPTAGTVLVVDSTMLGGMADEDLGGPGYSGAGPLGVEGKSIRDDARDQYRLRMRRVTVPVVTEPAAGRTITGV